MTQLNYQPTNKEKKRIRPQRGRLKVSGDGVFATRQGEGTTSGFPAVFLRLHYCNLSCGLINGWTCDTEYTWNQKKPEYWREPEDWTYQETARKIKKAWRGKYGQKKDKRLVITGGEPLLQQKKIIKLIDLLSEWATEIETNGTIFPFTKLHNCQFNCSPKLKNSGNLLSLRYKPEVLKKINTFPNSWFKFVVCQKTDLNEVEKIITECQLNPHKVLIMPEGNTAKQIIKKGKELSSAVVQKGWKLTQRNQLIWFGSKRKV